MHDHSIMVDYKGGPDQMHRGEKINAKNFKSNQAWSSEMDVNNTYCSVSSMNLTPLNVLLYEQR